MDAAGWWGWDSNPDLFTAIVYAEMRMQDPPNGALAEDRATRSPVRRWFSSRTSFESLNVCRSYVDPLRVSSGPLRASDGVFRHVLLVDDEPDVRVTLRANLEYEGLSVYEAATAPEGIELVEVHHPDLVVLDLVLPVKDGWWFLREVQQCSPPRPVVVV